MHIATKTAYLLAVTLMIFAGMDCRGRMPAPLPPAEAASGSDVNPDRREQERLQATIVDLERRASDLVLRLDATATELESTTAELEVPEWQNDLTVLQIESDDLSQIDADLNKVLQASYATAASDRSPFRSESLVRTALLHWTVLLRRHAGGQFHTEVEGLVNDPDCAGDIIHDQLLEQYFEALFRKTGSEAEAAAEAVSALSQLARQSACLGAQQSASLASHLYWSYAELIAFLRLNGLDTITPHVAQAAAVPLLLFYDVEKHRGPGGPLARWFREQREALVQGIAVGRDPASWHGLWLYDWRSGRLLGYQAVATPRDENEVNLTLFYASIASDENLGGYGCSFTEMIGRGANARGYLCAGSSCAAQWQGGIARGLSGDFGLALRGIAGAHQTAICTGPSGDSGANASGGRSCGGGLNIGGGGHAAKTVRCLSQQIVRAGTEVMRCMAETTGQCSNPIDKINKPLQDALFPGVKLGNCQYVASREGRAVNRTDKEIEDLGQKVRDLEREFHEAAVEHGVLKSSAEIALAAEAAAFEKWKETKSAEDKKKLDEASEDRREAIAKALEAKEKADKLEADKKKAEDDKKKAEGNKTNAQARCPPDTPECGTNECSGMSLALAQTSACIQTAVNPATPDPYAPQPPNGCNPTICDDFDPKNPADAAVNQCFTELAADPSAAASRQCWAVQCAAGQVAAVDSQGGCTCSSGSSDGGQPTGEGGVRNFCELARCDSGAAASEEATGGGPAPQPQFGKWNMGSCVCGGPGGLTTGGTAPQPPGPFVVPSAPKFLETNPAARAMATSAGILPEMRH